MEIADLLSAIFNATRELFLFCHIIKWLKKCLPAPLLSLFTYFFFYKKHPLYYLEVLHERLQEVVAELAGGAGAGLARLGGEQLLQAQVDGHHLLQRGPALAAELQRRQTQRRQQEGQRAQQVLVEALQQRRRGLAAPVCLADVLEVSVDLRAVRWKVNVYLSAVLAVQF